MKNIRDKLRNCLNKIQQQFINKERFIGLNEYNKSLENVVEQLFSILQEVWLKHQKSIKVTLVSVERGGNIPATVIHHKLERYCEKEIAEGLITFDLVSCKIQTRNISKVSDKAQNKNNNLALTNLLNNIKLKKEHLIIFIDDLVDSGITVKMINEFLRKTDQKQKTQYNSCALFISLFFKVDKNLKHPSMTLDNLCKLPDMKRLFKVHYDTVDNEPTNINMIIGKIIKTQKWLVFWYD